MGQEFGLKEVRRGLRSFLGEPGVRRLWRVTDAAHPGREGHVTLTAHPRFFIVLRGRRRVRFMRRGELVRVEMRPGDVMLSGPETWTGTEVDASFVSLGVVLSPEGMAFFYLDYAARGAPRGVPLGLQNRQRRFDHGAPLDAEGRMLVQLLLGGPEREPADGFALHVVRALGVKIEMTLDRPGAPGQGAAYERWRALRDHVSENYRYPMSRKQLAVAFRLHPSQISRLFRKFAGESFNNHLQNLRLERARSLLADSRFTVADVAALCGYASASYFARCWVRKFGLPPSRLRAG